MCKWVKMRARNNEGRVREKERESKRALGQADDLKTVSSDKDEHIKQYW